METNIAESQTMESLIKDLLSHYDNSEREGLKETPSRVIKMYNELLTSKEPTMTVFDSNGYNQMIVDKGIKYYSLCEHHLLPFFGDVKIGYIPDKKIIGLSKLSRIVEFFSRRLNTQEYFTQNICDYIDKHLTPKGTGVIVTGRHLCKEMRGVKQKGIMVTSALSGIFFDQKVKEEI